MSQDYKDETVGKLNKEWSGEDFEVYGNCQNEFYDYIFTEGNVDLGVEGDSISVIKSKCRAYVTSIGFDADAILPLKGKKKGLAVFNMRRLEEVVVEEV